MAVDVSLTDLHHRRTFDRRLAQVVDEVIDFCRVRRGNLGQIGRPVRYPGGSGQQADPKQPQYLEQMANHGGRGGGWMRAQF